MKKIIVAFALVLVSHIGFAQEKASREDVAKVIESSGASGQLNAAKKKILAMIPQDKQAAFVVEFDVIMKKINEKTIDIYSEEYTKDDIKAMLAFYNSPVGKKMSQNSEAIATKTQEALKDIQTEIQTMVMKYMQ